MDVEFIQEFPLDQRFIKLPIQAYLELLGIDTTINGPQIALINSINNSKYRFVCAALARRLGKTYIANVIAQLVLLVPGCNILIMSPNYNLSSISFELQRNLVKRFDLEIERDNLKDKLLELKNGSTVRMGSISTVDSCVGRSYDLIIFDEAALSEGGEDAFNVALRPTLDRPGSKAIFISTPRGKNNWFSKFYQRGFDPQFPEWVSLQADYTENHRMSSSDVEEARRSMSRQEFEQEYCASFTEFVGQIYGIKQTNIIEELPEDIILRKNCEFIAGCDPGYRDRTSFVVLGYSWERDCFYVVDEYEQSEVTTEQHAQEFSKLIDRWSVETVFIDSAAAQFSADLAYLYNIATTRAKKDVLPGIAYIQTLLAQDRLKVHTSCVNVLKMLDQYRWDNKSTNSRERPHHDDYSHMADALRYALYTYTV